MSLTGIRDIDIEILLKLNDIELCKVFTLNKYINNLYESNDFWYRRIINRISTTKKYNFSRIKTLHNIEITAERVREMQKYYGIDKLKGFNYFLNKLPENALYQDYFAFDNHDDSINNIYEKIFIHISSQNILIDRN